MRLVQYVDVDGVRGVAARLDGGAAHVVPGAATIYALAWEAIEAEVGLAALVGARGRGEPFDLHAAAAEGRLLAPLDHPDPAHMLVTGTGLTHLGSAEGRDKMHRDLADPAKLTDSMRMFKLGLEGGKPAPGEVGVQPEWFYKGDGSVVAAPGAPLMSPAFGLDAGEEPEVVGLYVVGPDGAPYRLGYALGNEFSDHVTERQNYLYLAHSKIRPCSFGPELVVGALPSHIDGVSRIRRGNAVVWEKPFVSGEANMCHSIENLEGHHFKYDLFRRPGDAHAHYFGTATLSFSDGVKVEPGDVFEIEAEVFGLPLTNPLAVAEARPVTIRAL
jgi:hypothetical protein